MRRVRRGDTAVILLSAPCDEVDQGGQRNVRQHAAKRQHRRGSIPMRTAGQNV